MWGHPFPVYVVPALLGGPFPPREEGASFWKVRGLALPNCSQDTWGRCPGPWTEVTVEMAATGRAGSRRGEVGPSFKEPAHVWWQHRQPGPELSPEHALFFHFFKPPLPFAPGPSESPDRPARFLPIYAGYPFLPPPPLSLSLLCLRALIFKKHFFGSQYGNPPGFQGCFLNSGF